MALRNETYKHLLIQHFRIQIKYSEFVTSATMLFLPVDSYMC